MPGVPEIAKLPAEESLPDPETLLEERPLIWALTLGAEGEAYEPSSLTKLKTAIQPMVTISSQNLAPIVTKTRDQATAVLEDHPELIAQLDEGGAALRDEVRKQASSLRDEIEEPLGGWCLLTESDPRRGEAQASADAALVAAKAFRRHDTTSASYIVKDVFFYGGKEPCNPRTSPRSPR
jgi:hypothetical protein